MNRSPPRRFDVAQGVRRAARRGDAGIGSHPYGGFASRPRPRPGVFWVPRCRSVPVRSRAPRWSPFTDRWPRADEACRSDDVSAPRRREPAVPAATRAAAAQRSLHAGVQQHASARQLLSAAAAVHAAPVLAAARTADDAAAGRRAARLPDGARIGAAPADSARQRGRQPRRHPRRGRRPGRRARCRRRADHPRDGQQGRRRPAGRWRRRGHEEEAAQEEPTEEEPAPTEEEAPVDPGGEDDFATWGTPINSEQYETGTPEAAALNYRLAADTDDDAMMQSQVCASPAARCRAIWITSWRTRATTTGSCCGACRARSLAAWRSGSVGPGTTASPAPGRDRRGQRLHLHRRRRGRRVEALRCDLLTA